MQLIRDRRLRRFETDPFRDLVQVDASPCYELICSLMVLYMPRIYQGFRQWSTAARKAMPRDLYEEGRFFFQGMETCVGFGAVRMVPELKRRAAPDALIEAIRKADPVQFALYMVEGPGSLTREQLDAFERLLRNGSTPAKLAAALRGVSAPRKQRIGEIIAAPDRGKKRFARFLERYNKVVFAREVSKLKAPLSQAARKAGETLAVLPTADAIERLTDGYAISTDLPLKRITLAPSVFLYPAVAIRIDERKGEGFVLYGVPSSFTDSGAITPINGTLLAALRALSDANRVQILRLVSEKPRLAPEIVGLLGLSQPTVHHHIRELWVAELIRQERTRSGMLCSLRLDGMNRVISSLSKIAAAAEAASANEGAAPGERRTRRR